MASLEAAGGRVTFFGHVTNSQPGRIKNSGATLHFLGGFTNEGLFQSDPADNYFSTLEVMEMGYLVAGLGDRFFVTGDLFNHSTRHQDWDTVLAELLFLTGGIHILDVNGTDRGAYVTGRRNNFAWGLLRLGLGQSLVLRDASSAPGGAFYTGVLMLDGGLDQIGLIDSGGLNIYYDPTQAGNAYLLGAAWQLTGGGWLAPADTPVPEPHTFIPAALAVLALLAAAARRKASPARPTA
ncbi:MAG: hypothetical protein FJW40_15685 [Acidobacteria bacterium]|nr:hypothetical protein [Acidobacteriota bacterium]